MGTPRGLWTWRLMEGLRLRQASRSRVEFNPRSVGWGEEGKGCRRPEVLRWPQKLEWGHSGYEPEKRDRVP